MAARAPAPTEAERIPKVVLFESAHDGFGDATEVRKHRYHRIHGSLDARWLGQARMGLAVREIVQNNLDRVPIFALEWTDTDTISPAIFYIAGDQYHKLLFGADTNVQAAGADLLTSGAGADAAALATGATFDDDGSGVPYVYVGFGGGATAQVMRRIAVDQTISTIASTTIRADLLLSLHSRMYRTATPTSGFANCGVSMCPLGANRFTAANWSALTIVGYAGTNINALLPLGRAPVAIKPEGIFAYNESALRWINRTPAWWRYPHARNGVGAFSLGDMLVIPMGDGGAVLFDGYRTTPFDPHTIESTPNLHTTSSLFSSMGSLRHEIAAATVVNSGTYANAKMISAGDDLRFFSYDNATATFTDGSANVRDGSLTTYAEFTINETTDALYIGWVRPFIGVQMAFVSVLNLVARTMTVAVSDGASGWNTIAVRDFTAQPVGTPLGQTGNIIMTADPVATQAWLTDTVNSVAGLYWVRITFSGALTAGIRIANMQIQPWYPSLDNTNYPLDGLDRSGALPHIVLGHKSQEGAVWHDLVTLPEPDEIGAIIYGNLGGSNLNRYRNLVAIGRFSVWRIDITPDEHPGTMSHPFLNDIGLIEFPAFVPNDGKLSRLKSVTLFGHDSDPNLIGRFYYTWDSGEPWNMAPLKLLRFPAHTEIRQPQRGYRFRWAFGWTQASATARASQPSLDYVEAEFEALDDRVDTDQERVMQAAPRF